MHCLLLCAMAYTVHKKLITQSTVHGQVKQKQLRVLMLLVSLAGSNVILTTVRAVIAADNQE